jgi:periplasmic protein CpxP/Spy
MLTRYLLAAACAAALAGAAFAEDAHHPDPTAKPAAKPGPGMNMGKMGETMQRMQEQMKQIQAASDPKERQRLLEEHMKTMQEAMPMMAGMKDMQGCMGMMQPQK